MGSIPFSIGEFNSNEGLASIPAIHSNGRDVLFLGWNNREKSQWKTIMEDWNLTYYTLPVDEIIIFLLYPNGRIFLLSNDIFDSTFRPDTNEILRYFFIYIYIYILYNGAFSREGWTSFSRGGKALPISTASLLLYVCSGRVERR